MSEVTYPLLKTSAGEDWEYFVIIDGKKDTGMERRIPIRTINDGNDTIYLSKGKLITLPADGRWQTLSNGEPRSKWQQLRMEGSS